MIHRSVWARRILLIALAALVCQQVWRHGHDYIFAEEFAELVPGKIYRGAWQKDWPMRRLVRDYNIKTIVALAHPPHHPLAIQEKALAEELHCRWIHIPIVDERGECNGEAVSDQLEEAAAVLADSANQPVYFHCHHGLNRASMVQIAYRTIYCGWTLEQARAEIAQTFGLKEVRHGPDYRHMTTFYNDRVLPRRRAQALTAQAAAPR